MKYSEALNPVRTVIHTVTPLHIIVNQHPSVFLKGFILTTKLKGTPTKFANTNSLILHSTYFAINQYITKFSNRAGILCSLLGLFDNEGISGLGLGFASDAVE